MESRRTKDVARKDNAKRTLLWLLAFLLVLVGSLGYGVMQKDATWTPRLGLDLEGGTQIILEPRSETGQVSQEELAQARDIIVQRIDSQGTTGAEVTTQGDSNIVIAMPGTPTKEQEEAIAASSQMQFRPVLASAAGKQPQSNPGKSGKSGSQDGTSGSQDKTSKRSSDADSASRDQARPAETSATSPGPKGEDEEPKPAKSSDSQSDSKKSSKKSQQPKPPGGQSGWQPTGKPKNAMDPNNVSEKLWQEFQDLDCKKGVEEDRAQPDEAIIACSKDGAMKYILGPTVVNGTEIDDATAGYAVGPQGQQTNNPEIQLSLTSEGREDYKNISEKMVGAQSLSPAGANPPASYNALAVTLDSQVLMAPGFNEVIPNGKASISGFQIDEARSLAKSLKFGALPLSFDLQSRQEISPTLGSAQLEYGIIAGAIGLFLVFIYSIFQYRVLASVTMGSMIVAFGMTYLAIALLSWGYNYRLDMAGVTGLIIAIGVTADSFIVYFERIRDALREGRNVRAAVEAGWARAKRTILVADGVNLIAAVVLYVLASSSVRGFAFTLGLTTLIDLAVFWLFTHPVLTVLARSRFFSSQHPWSGFDVGDPSEATIRYRGRGSVDFSPGVRPAEGGTR
ncbi:protein translocase subunit SecD [Janibacter corallicola]|uniref:protein translocase subunit SecD n=1 Tax=Janibacter corallicola TaxID=415212 RepID=UPI000834DB95|nr:protein translocase subunit SecD [Janibacter corallicola]